MWGEHVNYGCTENNINDTMDFKPAHHTLFVFLELMLDQRWKADLIGWVYATDCSELSQVYMQYHLLYHLLMYPLI